MVAPRAATDGHDGKTTLLVQRSGCRLRHGRPFELGHAHGEPAARGERDGSHGGSHAFRVGFVPERTYVVFKV
jgi:hypothetical protein